MYANSRHVRHVNSRAFYIWQDYSSTLRPPFQSNPCILTFPFCIPQQSRAVRTVVKAHTKVMNSSPSEENGDCVCVYNIYINKHVIYSVLQKIFHAALWASWASKNRRNRKKRFFFFCCSSWLLILMSSENLLGWDTMNSFILRTSFWIVLLLLWDRGSTLYRKYFYSCLISGWC